MATHSSILTWRIPGTEEPGGLQSMGLQRITYLQFPTLLFEPFRCHITFTVGIGSGYPADTPPLGQLAHPGPHSPRGTEQVLVQGRQVIPTENT